MSTSTFHVIASQAMGCLNKFVSFARDERVVLVSIGIASYSLVRALILGLELVRESSAIPPTLPKTRYITQDTEDALEPRTLDKLLKHPSFAIREIAVKILCERAVNNKDVVTHLLIGITRKDYDERMMSLRALAMLTGQQTGKESLLRSAPRSIVRLLTGSQALKGWPSLTSQRLTLRLSDHWSSVWAIQNLSRSMICTGMSTTCAT